MGSIVSAQSENKSFYVSEKIDAISDGVGEYNSVEYSVKSIDDILLYKIINKTDYDIPYSKLEVFNNGYSVLISAFYGTLIFFNNSGVKFKLIKLSADIDVEYERSIKSVIDINTLLVLFSDLKSGFSTIQKYNFNGKNGKSFNIEKINITGLAYSGTLNQICLSYIDWDRGGNIKKGISLIDEDGVLLKDYNANFEKGFFAEDNQFIAFSNKSLISINTENLEINFQSKPANGELYIDVTASKGSIIAVAAETPKLQYGKWYYKNPTIIKIDLSGKLLNKTVVETNSFSDFGFKKTNKALLFTVGHKSITLE